MFCSNSSQRDFSQCEHYTLNPLKLACNSSFLASLHATFLAFFCWGWGGGVVGLGVEVSVKVMAGQCQVVRFEHT